MKKKMSVSQMLLAGMALSCLMMCSPVNAADKVVVIPLFSQNSDTDSTYTNSVGMTFSRIPAGSFIMGSPDGINGRAGDTHRPFWPPEFGSHIPDNEQEIQHLVSITRPFYMQTTEVTQRQYLQVMGSSGYTNPANFQSCGLDCPVEKVSWEEARLFIETLNTMENRTGCDKTPNSCYSLPTEAQWEYAARAGTVTAFYSGGISAEGHASCDVLDSNLDLIGWYECNSGGTTHEVAGKKPNNWGLYDMSGNVEEWCADRSNSGVAPEEDLRYPPEDLTYNGAPVADPQGRTTGSHRISRGGSWDHDASSARSAKRYHHDPTSRFPTLGFRVMLSISE